MKIFRMMVWFDLIFYLTCGPTMKYFDGYEGPRASHLRNCLQFMQLTLRNNLYAWTFTNLLQLPLFYIYATQFEALGVIEKITRRDVTPNLLQFTTVILVSDWVIRSDPCFIMFFLSNCNLVTHHWYTWWSWKPHFLWASQCISYVITIAASRDIDLRWWSCWGDWFFCSRTSLLRSGGRWGTRWCCT